MPQNTIEFPVYDCLRCSHKWISNKTVEDGLPLQCPKCHSVLWNKPREKEEANKVIARSQE